MNFDLIAFWSIFLSTGMIAIIGPFFDPYALVLSVFYGIASGLAGKVLFRYYFLGDRDIIKK